MSEWLQQFSSQEEAALFNPAFLAVVIRKAAESYESEVGVQMPISLAFLVVPAAMSKQIRDTFPVIKTTSLLVWIEAHERECLILQKNAPALAPAVRRALILGSQMKLFEFPGSRIQANPARGIRSLVSLSQGSSEVKEVLKVAERLGKSFARSGDVASIFSIWGVAAG
ncbi:three component ABC system middle component [Streptomyces sp. NRRL F-2664]|uniref:three component ABC system middle component n=1 Tax=Streptomyces sp. NRRL F-2664 TaxID=1463842 RepID=UPI00131C9F84|nr:three component ABC system middle component [Streptomyces sp. NRRL F-2664]